MARTIEAVYEQGVFKPLQPVVLEEGQYVAIYLPAEGKSGPATPEAVEEIMRIARQVYEGLSDEDIDEIEAGFSCRSVRNTKNEEKR
jgi:predicted DNA-binding antitoxin AbrB/MazE fold protein